MRKPAVTTAVLLAALLARDLSAQVRIEMSARRHKIEKKITAKVVNSTQRCITYRVMHGVVGLRNGNRGIRLEPISSPFEIWRATGGKWESVPIFLDGVGHYDNLVELKPGESQESWFKIDHTGEMRLVLEYRFGHWTEPYKNLTRIRSQVFTVR